MLGSKARDGRLVLVCKRVGAHDRWVVAKAVKKGPTLAKVKKAFTVDTAPAEAALRTFKASLEVLGINVTPAEAAQAPPPLAAACRKLDRELTALHVTGRVGKDIRTFVDENAKIALLLGSVRAQERSSLPTWAGTLLKDAERLRATDEVLRSTLGLGAGT
jgi:hypothetical protein